MTVRLAHALHGAEMTTPGAENRTVRLKYVHVSEMLADCLAANAADGRTQCPVCDYLAAHLDDDVIAVERYVHGHAEWGPSLLTGTIRNTPKFNNAATDPQGDVIAGIVQHDAALALARHPWSQTRPEVERMLRDPDTHFVTPEAAYVVLAYFNAHHPNPRKFLEKPEVAGKFAPFGVNIAAFPAPGFDEPGSPS